MNNNIFLATWEYRQQPLLFQTHLVREKQMATVTPMSVGYEFADLNAVGKRLVNEFQRLHPLLCKPSPQPSYRYIRLGSSEQNLELRKLVINVIARDLYP